MTRWFAALWLPWALLVQAAQAAPLRQEVLDDFRAPAAWQATASDQVRTALRRDRDGSLCLDVDFAGVSGYAVMRRALPVAWPAHFDLVARLKGGGATNDIQFKLVDAGGDNVWWLNRPDLALPGRLTELKIRRRHIDFAWGPAADRTLRKTQFVEFVVAAGRGGGRSSLCVARLTLQERQPDPADWPAPQVRHDAGTTDIDLGLVREFNGLALRWPDGVRDIDYDVLGSGDGRRWRALRRVRGSDGGLDALFLPESEARHL
ncbi:MAG: coagulation factor 5/8 type domain-containing protein, partial [Rubrivivax sp.]|nr:coagulation factor 5/8 type domain-containing protein [Rubrivivax sp.]